MKLRRFDYFNIFYLKAEYIYNWSSKQTKLQKGMIKHSLERISQQMNFFRKLQRRLYKSFRGDCIKSFEEIVQKLQVQNLKNSQINYTTQYQNYIEHHANFI
ncbi:unnamed protein product [Paramecium pentaurelia]|uniref:Uncharacterized protein n=1 Tax=Paramecium pentaurelia TaxID=43138 RepID=A0A8S1XTH0_9CILI|nr:unnamed protein product [Paramecium pentaurelia]